MDKNTKKRIDIKTQYAVEELEQTILMTAYLSVYDLVLDYYTMKKNTDEKEKYAELYNAFTRIIEPKDGIDIFHNLYRAYEKGLITKALIKDYVDIITTVMLPSVYTSCVMTRKVLKDINTEDSRVIIKYLSDIFNGYLIGLRNDLPASPASKGTSLYLNARLNKVYDLYNKLWCNLIKDRIDSPEVEIITLSQALIQSLYFNARRAVDATTIGYLESDKTGKVLDKASKLIQEIYDRTVKKLGTSSTPIVDASTFKPIKRKTSDEKKPTTKKESAKKELAKKAATKKVPANKTTKKKEPAKKTTTKKTEKKPTTKRTTTKKTEKKPTTKKATTKKATTKKK